MSTDSFTRLGSPNNVVLQKYGPLSNLMGIWSGNKGVNLIAVPDQKGSFKLLVAPYSETLTITALSSPTPNRGLTKIDQIPTLMYSLSIYNSLDNSLMHAENGIWELIDPTDNEGFNLARITTVPHGDAVIAMGNSSVTPQPAIDTKLSSLPFLSPGETFQLPLDYTQAYEAPIVNGFDNQFPNTYLNNYLQAQLNSGMKINSSTNLVVSTDNLGAVSNIPSQKKNAVATKFNSVFWLESMVDTDGNPFMQLQYSQNTTIDFPIKGTPAGKTIHWPHINVNTLIKQ
jgi:hypothetical protein